MKTWIVSSLDEETIQREETIQGRKLYEEIQYFNCVTFFVWMPKLNFKFWTYSNIDKISQWEQSHYKSQFEFSYYCAFPRFLFGFDRKNLLKSWKLVWIGLLKWLSPMWGFNQIYNPIFNFLSKDIYRTAFKKHQYDAVLLL